MGGCHDDVLGGAEDAPSSEAQGGDFHGQSCPGVGADLRLIMVDQFIKCPEFPEIFWDLRGLSRVSNMFSFARHVFPKTFGRLNRCSLSTTSLSRHGDSAVAAALLVPRGLAGSWVADSGMALSGSCATLLPV